MTNNFTLPATAWAITEHGLHHMLTSYHQASLGISLEDFFSPRQAMQMQDGIATIHVKGSLLDNAPPIHSKLDGTDYRQIRSEIEQAKEQGAQGFFFLMDSPGGSVAGLAEVAQMISEIEEPTLAYADGLMCSACYYLAASCDAIGASPSATVGNIGTILSWYDMSEAMESMGVKIQTITNEGADLKGTFRENPMSESQREFLQAQADQMGEEFQNHVASNRAVDEEVFRAGWYHGEQAASLGLVDEITTKRDAYAALKQEITMRG